MTENVRPNSRVRAIIGAFLLAGISVLGAQAPQQETPEVEEILLRALQRAQLAEEQDAQGAFSWKSIRTSTQFDSEGAVKQQETEAFLVRRIGNTVSERLVELDGRPLSPKEEKKQESEENPSKRKGSADGRSRRDEVRFDRQLVDRFDFKLQGQDLINSRPVWRLDFEPRGGKLPQETRIDVALNNSRGSILVDQQTYEIARVHFELIRPIRIWWGIIGRLTEVSGTIDRRPAGGAWFPSSVDILFKGRILFSTIYRRALTLNSDFKALVATASGPRSEAAGIEDPELRNWHAQSPRPGLAPPSLVIPPRFSVYGEQAHPAHN